MIHINDKKLLVLAKQYCPTLICGLSKGKDHLIDFPTEIYLHYFSPHKNGDLAIYYDGWENGQNIYLMYALFHRKDKNHEYDFEGFLINPNKAGGVVSISHFAYIYNTSPVPFIYVEPGTHGIAPGYVPGCWYMRIQPYSLKFIPMFGMEWDRTVTEAAPKFNKHGVKWPWQWNSFQGTKYLIRQWGRQHLRNNLDGLIYYRPDLLFELIENWSHKSTMIPKLKEYLKERK